MPNLTDFRIFIHMPFDTNRRIMIPPKQDDLEKLAEELKKAISNKHFPIECKKFGVDELKALLPISEEYATKRTPIVLEFGEDKVCGNQIIEGIRRRFDEKTRQKYPEVDNLCEPDNPYCRSLFERLDFRFDSKVFIHKTGICIAYIKVQVEEKSDNRLELRDLPLLYDGVKLYFHSQHSNISKLSESLRHVYSSKDQKYINKCKNVKFEKLLELEENGKPTRLFQWMYPLFYLPNVDLELEYENLYRMVHHILAGEPVCNGRVQDFRKNNQEQTKDCFLYVGWECSVLAGKCEQTAKKYQGLQTPGKYQRPQAAEKYQRLLELMGHAWSSMYVMDSLLDQELEKPAKGWLSVILDLLPWRSGLGRLARFRKYVVSLLDEYTAIKFSLEAKYLALALTIKDRWKFDLLIESLNRKLDEVDKEYEKIYTQGVNYLLIFLSVAALVCAGVGIYISIFKK